MTFRRAFVVVLVGLLVLVGGFAALDRMQGPKLAAVLADPSALVAEPGQLVQLTINERIDRVKPSQVHVTPAAPFTLQASGQQLAIRFPDPLRYSTDYRVRISAVTSADDGAVSTVNYSFRTPAGAIYYLDRSHSSAPDQILRVRPASSAVSEVFAAPRIQDFAVLPTGLAVVTLGVNGNSALELVDALGKARAVRLPGTGTIGVIHADPTTGTLGFTFTGNGTASNYVDALFTVDTATSTRPKLVKGLGGKPLSLLNWFFVPGSTQLVGLGGDGGALLADPTNPNGEVPFGSYFTLNSVSPDGTKASVSDINGALSLALPSGKPSRLNPSTVDGAVPIGGAAQSIPGGWLQVDSVYGAAIKSFSEHLVFDTGHTSRQIFTPSSPLGAIDGFSGSPGSQYVAVEVTPDVASAKPDGYQVNGQPTSIETVIVDVATGKTLATLQGFDAQW